MKKISIIFWFILLSFITFLVNLPIITMVLNSFKTDSEIMSSKKVLPQNFTFENYKNFDFSSDFWLYFYNSVLITVVSTVVGIVVASLAGYAISRFRSPILSVFSRSLLILQMFPAILILVPLFVVLRNLYLLNTHFSVIIIYTTLHLPFSVWLFKGFMDTIPRELEEAAFIDGCSRLGTFIRIILPISGSGIAAIAIFSFLFTWNEFLIANVFLKDQSLLTLPIGLQKYLQQYSTEWGELTAASTLSMLPVLILLLFVQKYMAYGSLSGSVKG